MHEDDHRAGTDETAPRPEAARPDSDRLSPQETVRLYGLMGGRCAKCRTLVVRESEASGQAFNLGVRAHIVGRSDAGPRGDAGIPVRDRGDIRNHLLLCGTCHTEIDRDVEGWPLDRLQALRAEHLRWVADQDAPRTSPSASSLVIGVDAPEANVLVIADGAKRSLSGRWVDIELWLVALPFYATEGGAEAVTAVLEVERAGNVVSRGHGRWRELPPSPWDATTLPPTTGFARPALITPNSERHVLDVLVQERPPTRPWPGWLVARDPLKLAVQGPLLAPGDDYRLTVRLRQTSGDVSEYRYGLVIPADSELEAPETAPVLTPESSARS